MNITRKYRLMEKIAGRRGAKRALEAAWKQLRNTSSWTDNSPSLLGLGTKPKNLSEVNQRLRNKLVGFDPRKNRWAPALSGPVIDDIGLDLKKLKILKEKETSRDGFVRKALFPNFVDGPMFPRRVRPESIYSVSRNRRGPAQNLGYFRPLTPSPSDNIGRGHEDLWNFLGERHYPRRDMIDKSSKLRKYTQYRSSRAYGNLIKGLDNKPIAKDIRKFNAASLPNQIDQIRSGAFADFLGPNPKVDLESIEKRFLSSALEPKAYRTPKFDGHGSAMYSHMKEWLPIFINHGPHGRRY